MKNILKQMIFIFCCVMLCSVPSYATSTNITDNADRKVNVTTPFATISDAYLSQTTVKKDDVLKYRFTISFVDSFDYNSEEFSEGPFKERSAYFVTVWWQSSGKQKFERTYKWSKNKESLVIDDKISVQKGMQAGEWKISAIYIANGIGEDGGDSLVIFDGTEADQMEKGSFCVHYTDLSDLSFQVTGVKKKADNKAPTIDKKSIKVSKTTVKKNKKATFSVKVKDASGIEDVEFSWLVKTKNGEVTRDCKLKYNKKKKCYQCKFEMKKNDKKAELYCITTKDIYGNEYYYTLDNTSLKKKYGKAFSKVTIYRKK